MTADILRLESTSNQVFNDFNDLIGFRLVHLPHLDRQLMYHLAVDAHLPHLRKIDYDLTRTCFCRPGDHWITSEDQ